MDFDKIIAQIGEFGRYQRRLIFFISLPPMLVAMNALSNIFTSAVPKHRCFIDDCDNSSTQYNAPWINYTIPLEPDNSTYSSCKRNLFNISSSKCPAENSEWYGSESCNKWKYDISEYKSTVVTQWNLICRSDVEFLRPLNGSIWMFGVIVGAVIYGYLADRFGRRFALLIGFFVFIVAGFAVPFSVTYTMFLCFRFIQATAASGIYQTLFVLGLEFVGKSKRVSCGIFINFTFAFGEILLGVIAYFVRDWRTLQLVMAAPSVFCILYYWFMPESVRWLIAKKRYNEAKSIVIKAARVNKAHLPASLLQFDVDPYEFQCEHSQDEQSKKASAIDLVRNPKLRWRSVNIFINWFMNTVGYYGISMNSANLGGNVFVNFILTSAVEIPAYIFCLLVLDRLGRRLPLGICMIGGGLCCMGTALVPANRPDLQWISLFLSMIGKFGTSAAFAIIYIYSAELFPTVLRNNGIGLSSFFAHVGGVIAPYIASLTFISKSLPLVIFGLSMFVSGVMAFCLPETLGLKLPETIEDAENLGIKCTSLHRRSTREEENALLSGEDSDVNSIT